VKQIRPKRIYLLEVLNDMPRNKAALFLLSLATACVPATLLAQQPAAQITYGAVPGSLQFVQGQANIDGQPIDANATSSTSTAQPRQLHANETLATANGTADILLAPGALLRIGQDSTVRMVSEDPTRTEVRLEQGRANVSVNLVRDHNLLLLDMPNGQTQILSRGLYTFNTADNTVRVFNGEAQVYPGANTDSDVKAVKVKESHEIILGGDRAKPAKFDRETADADLLPWTGPKETQAALADSSISRNPGVNYSYAGYPGYGYDGFYGDYPLYAGYGYPYGWAGPWGPYGFYGYPFFGVGFGYWGGGFYGGYPLRGRIGHGYVGHGYAGNYGRGGYGAARGFAGGGFHGGGGFSGGGFHGGGFGGGGFHGGGGHR
jgi:hypothetical protein